MKKPSLEEFAKANPTKSGYRSWMDTLPDDVLEQVDQAGDISSRQIVAWLRSIGFDQATYSKVDHWRRSRGRRPTKS
jgi:hypothetical protein